MSRGTKINSLTDLIRERELLRGKIAHQEEVLRDHYDTLEHSLNPLFRILNFISGNRFFKGAKSNDEKGSKTSWTGILFDVLSAGFGTGFIFGRKKNKFKSLFDYGIDQTIDYITEKDISEHIEKIKEWFSSLRKKNKDETWEDEETSRDPDSYRE